MKDRIKHKIHMRLNIKLHNIAIHLHESTRSTDFILFSKQSRHCTGYGCVCVCVGRSAVHAVCVYLSTAHTHCMTADIAHIENDVSAGLKNEH